VNTKVYLANVSIYKYDRRKGYYTFLAPARKVSKEQAKGALRANAPPLETPAALLLYSANLQDVIFKQKIGTFSA